MARGRTQLNPHHIPSIIIVGTCLLFYASFATAAEVLVDRVLGSVNGQPFLYSDVANKVQSGPLITVSEFPATEQSPPFEKAMQDIINFQLIQQKAKELELDVSNDELESEIADFLGSKGLDKRGLQSFLAKENKSYEEYKQDFRNQIILGRFQRRVIAPLIKVTDRDLETAYMKRSGAASDLVEITLRQISIQIPDGSGQVISEAKRALAREARSKIEGGVAFEDAVKLYSDDRQKAANGGLLEPVRLKDLAPAIRKEIERLDTGGVTPPLEISSSILIFKVEDRKVSLGKDMQKKRAELEAEIRNAELANQTRRWLSEQRQRSKIEIIAK
jgi:peptidyl-prolyl cis-trans isomerase SurA